MYIFEIITGRLTQFGSLIGTGWAGQAEGKNNADMVNVPNIGPLPPGFYTIGPAHTEPRLGPVVMDLSPDPANVMYGRSLFRIHGASASDPEHSSEGCVVMPRPVRELIAEGSDKRLWVVPDLSAVSGSTAVHESPASS